MHSIRCFLLTIYIALLPKGVCGSAGWVSNTTLYDCCHYRRTQERNMGVMNESWMIGNMERLLSQKLKELFEL